MTGLCRAGWQHLHILQTEHVIVIVILVMITTIITYSLTHSLTHITPHLATVYTFFLSLPLHHTTQEESRRTPSSEDYYPKVAVTALMKILRDSSLSVHHSSVTQAIM